MSDDSQKALVAGFSPDVYESMMALRRLAQDATSLAHWRQTGRYATPEEIALSEALRTPDRCSGHSARTGLACTNHKLKGMSVCRRHGGSLTRVKAKAERRLAAMVDPVLDSMFKAATQEKHMPAAVKAGQDLLDRAGIGEDMAIRARSSQGGDGKGKIEVRIGFLSMVPGQASATILVPNPENGEE